VGEFLFDNIAVVIEGIVEVGDRGRGGGSILGIVPGGPAQVIVGYIIINAAADVGIGPKQEA